MSMGSVYLLLFYTDGRYNALREDLEADARDFEAPTWSLAVDQNYLKNYSKDAIKRQDVIHGKRCDNLFCYFFCLVEILFEQYKKVCYCFYDRADSD